MDDVLMPAGYELSEEERDLMDHLHGIFAAEDEIFGEGDAETDADDEPPFDADEQPLEEPAVRRERGRCRRPRPGKGGLTRLPTARPQPRVGRPPSLLFPPTRSTDMKRRSM